MAAIEQVAKPEPREAAKRRGLRWRWKTVLIVLCLACLLAEGMRVVVWSNFHVVVPGRVYRCAQPNPKNLERLIREHGIRTVVNLRGGNVDIPWYRAEGKATANSDAAQEDICLSAGRLPSTHEVRRLIEVLDRTEYPVLLHCRRGSDRTGLAAAITLLLQADVDFEDAQRQLGLRYGHLNLGRTAHLDEFFEQYREWLASKEQGHSAKLFRQWAQSDYLPGGYRCRLEPLELPTAKSEGVAVPLKMRAHNTGSEPWRFRPGSNAGIHIGFVIQDMQGKALANGRSGLVNAELPPGSSMDFTLVLPSWVASGNRYRILVDMVEEQQFWFFQTGSEPWEWEFQARDQASAAARERRPAELAVLAH